MARINYEPNKTERAKQCHEIITIMWKWLKPRTEIQFPITDKEWDEIVATITQLGNEITRGKGVPEAILILRMQQAFLDYLHYRESEVRRAPN